MKLWLGTTDKDWFDYLSVLRPDEVNFWKPGGSGSFKVLEPGGLFLFKLKKPYNAIAGGGFFVNHMHLPLSTAWNVFEQKNGSDDFQTFRDKILSYRSPTGGGSLDPVIGCVILASPFFFPPEQWIPQPASWNKNIVQGKTYDTETEEVGAWIYQQIQARLQFSLNSAVLEHEHLIRLAVDVERRYGIGEAKYRLGQGAFRVLVMNA